MPAAAQEPVSISRDQNKFQAEAGAADPLSQTAMVPGDLTLKSQVELKEPEPDTIRQADTGIRERVPIIDTETYRSSAAADERIDR